MAYEIIIKPSAEKAFGKLPNALQVKILEALEQLSVNPRPSGVKKLKSTFNIYRIRVGEYRVIYSINDTLWLCRLSRLLTVKTCTGNFLLFYHSHAPACECRL